MSGKARGRGRAGTDVLEDFDPVAIVAGANEKAAGTPAPPAPRRRKARPAVDPWVRVAFNSKVPRWVRSATRAFADQEGQDLQDLHAAALVAYMRSHGFDVDFYLPDAEVSPPPTQAAKLADLLSDDTV